jgi:hypothetical protein
MKFTKYILLLAMVVGFTQCCKEKPNTKTDILGLPPATQTGANTLGFLLNGVPWTPAGNNGTANLSISFDPGFNNGVFGISAYRIISGNRSSFGIGISDSLNLLAIPLVRKLTSTSIYSAAFSKFDSCVLDSYYDSVSSSGSLTISKLDRIGGVISGEFNFKLSGLGCDTVFVTQGRFDMKF